MWSCKALHFCRLSLVSYVAFVSLLFVPHLVLFWLQKTAELRFCGISWISSLIYCSVLSTSIAMSSPIFRVNTAIENPVWKAFITINAFNSPRQFIVIYLP